jgi:predicted alpha/beta superfamily hydrolase
MNWPTIGAHRTMPESNARVQTLAQFQNKKYQISSPLKIFDPGGFIMQLKTIHCALFIFTLLLGVGAFSQPSHASNLDNLRAVTFTIKVPTFTPANSKIYVTGDQPELCNWGAACQEAKLILPNIYQVTVNLPQSVSQMNYKITRGSWDSDASDSFSHEINNYNYMFNVADPTAVETVLDIVQWRDLPPLGVTGNLQIAANFYSPQLNNSRTLRIWLPPSYTQNSNKHYPVIYAHDGQNLFDPATSGSQVEWSLDETLQSMIQTQNFPEVIVVGVDCNANRMNEYDYTALGVQYADFLINTVKPYIDQTYRTLPGRESTYSMGSSMGALISMALIWDHSDVFSKAAGLSFPALIKNAAPYKIVDAAAVPALPVQFYLDSGDYNNDANYPAAIGPFLQHLAQIGFPASELTHQQFHYADHFEADWARRVSIPLTFLLKGPALKR